MTTPIASEPERLVDELMRLATQMMRDSWATGNDASWQPAYQALRTALESALSSRSGSAAETAGWRPMETAPKDGSEFWAAQAGAPECGVIAWDEDMERWQDAMDGYEVPNWRPTHWMPLPQPPSTSTPDGNTEGEKG